MIHFVGSSEYACRALVTAADCNARGERGRGIMHVTQNVRWRERERDSIDESPLQQKTCTIIIKLGRELVSLCSDRPNFWPWAPIPYNCRVPAAEMDGWMCGRESGQCARRARARAHGVRWRTRDPSYLEAERNEVKNIKNIYTKQAAKYSHCPCLA